MGEDRRVKLTDKQREEILKLKGKDTQTAVANKYGVSRRTIDFIWHPEKKKRNLELRAKRGGSKQYYDKEKNTEAIRKYRQRKKEENAKN